MNRKLKKTFSALLALCIVSVPCTGGLAENDTGKNKNLITAMAYTTGDYVVKTNTGSGLNVRSSPTISGSNTLGSARNGEHFTVSSVSGNWGYTNAIKCKSGQTVAGWVYMQYTCSTGSTSSAGGQMSSNFSSGNYVVSVNTVLNVRNSPSMSGSVINTLGNGTVVNITSQSGNWGYAENYGGYVSMSYCRPVTDNSGGTSSGSSYSSGAVRDKAVYTIVPVCARNSCLDIKDRSTSNGSSVQIWEKTGGNNQKFTAIDCGNGYYMFQDVNSGKALDIPGGVPLPLVGLQLYDVNKTDAQLWRIEDAGDGSYRMKSKVNESFYLDVRNGNSGNGTAVEIYPGNGSDAQKFIFEETTVESGGSVGGGSSYLVDTSSKPASNVVTYSRAADGEKQLSEHFKVKEFACKDGSDKILIDDQLVYYCEMIRQHFGGPVTINSGYRNPNYNANVKGAAKNSMHMYGKAADIAVSGASTTQVAQYAESIGVMALHAYDSWTHIDTRPSYARW